MDALVENVDRSNSENKLIDFLARSHDLYREVKHQQLLTEKGVSHFFSLKVQDVATWITFIIACLINLLFIAYYNYSAGHARPTVTSTTALTVINTFNILQNIVGAFVIVLNCVVRSPVLYQAHTAAGHDFWRASLLTASDSKTLYFCAYLVLSLLGLLAADYYLPFLLLDIVAKNATTRDVLNAVVIPRKQLGMTVVLAIFVTYIFAYFIVSPDFPIPSHHPPISHFAPHFFAFAFALASS
jgi:magnesium-transporting ATPase (P-type)